MIQRIIVLVTMVSAVVVGSSGCATKKYARNRIDERVTPLEQRTGEMEETSRRNTQDIARLNDGITDVRGRADKAQSQAEGAQAKADQATARAAAAEQSVADVRNNLDKYAVQTTATVNFGFDRYDLTPEARAGLDGLAAQVQGRDNYVLEIEGFADSVGRDAYNDQLTQKRADAVRRYLAEQHNIPLFRMYILGFGERRPVAENSTRAGRAQNRRVEVRVMMRNTAAGNQVGQAAK